MYFLIIAALVGLSAYLGFRLSITRSENTVLRANVASLKRQLRS
jgi:hypothetical protein